MLATIDLPVVVALTAPRPCRLEYPPAAADKFQKAYAWTEQFSLSGFHTKSIEIAPSLAEDWKALACMVFYNRIQTTKRQFLVARCVQKLNLIGTTVA